MHNDTPRDWLEHDYYAVLGVPPSASRDDVVHAYRRLARTTHPDADIGNPAAAERFELINAARTTLTDPATKSAYDRVHQAVHQARAPVSARTRKPWHVDRTIRRPGPKYASPGPAIWIPDRPGAGQNKEASW